MDEPRTDAGRWLESEEPYLTSWAWGPLGTRVVRAIEDEAARNHPDCRDNCPCFERGRNVEADANPF